MSILTLIDGKSSEEIGEFFKSSINEFVKASCILKVNKPLTFKFYNKLILSSKFFSYTYLFSS